jgi:hypothetical protein
MANELGNGIDEHGNMTILKGTTVSIPIVWKDATGAVINITGYTAKLHIRNKHDSADPPLVELTQADGLVIDGANGKITISRTPAQLALWPGFLRGVYDLELTSGAGVVTRLIEGIVVVKPEVTR